MSLSEKLITAAKSGNTREVRKLLARGALFIKDQFGNTALHEAAWNGNNDIVKILLNAFCFVDSINNTGFTPLHLASQNGHVKVVKTLLKWKADPTLCNQHGETALHLVAKYDHANVMAVFASFKVNMNVRGKDDNTALHIAAKLGNIATMKALINAGACTFLTNSRGLQPLECAERGGYKEATKLLLSSQKSKMRSRMSASVERTYSTSPEVEKPKNPNLHRSMSTSARPQLRPAKDVWAAVHKKKMNPLSQDHFSPVTQAVGARKDTSPARFFGSRDELNRECTRPDKNASIEELLSEIEREYGGPDYKYTPPRDEVDTSGQTGRQTYLARDGTENYDILVPTTSRNKYDLLLPTMTTSLAPEERFKHHHYESLSPKSPFDDGDTYVYMAPRRQFERAGSLPIECRDEIRSVQETGSNSDISNGKSKTSKKVALLYRSPIHLNTKHEPNSCLEPPKGILTQPSNGEPQTQLEKYLEGELETMRQAFQIRLTQLEKRYQRQLVSEQKRKTSGGHVPLRNKNVNPLSPQQQCSTQRRRSWHSHLPDQEMDHLVDGERRAGSSLGMESDCSIDESDIDELDRNYKRGEKQREGLKGGASSWREEEKTETSPRMPPIGGFYDDDDDSLTVEAKGLIQEKLKQHRGKMMEYFKEKSEARLAVIEKQYQAQMSEVERKCEEKATEKLTRLESRIKDLENIIEVQTLV